MGVLFSCCDVRIAVRMNEPELLSRVVESLPTGSEPVAGETAPCLYSLYQGGPAPRPGVRTMSLLYRNSVRVERAEDLRGQPLPDDLALPDD